jgi:hypothetical protein
VVSPNELLRVFGDMHIKQAKIHGERELRLYHPAAWRESTLMDVLALFVIAAWGLFAS